jgi:hypothetical protein
MVMAQALRRANRAVRIRRPSRDVEEMVGARVDEILDSGPESATRPRMLDAAIGIRNGVIVGAIFWAVAAAFYFVLG